MTVLSHVKAPVLKVRGLGVEGIAKRLKAQLSTHSRVVFAVLEAQLRSKKAVAALAHSLRFTTPSFSLYNPHDNSPS